MQYLKNVFTFISGISQKPHKCRSSFVSFFAVLSWYHCFHKNVHKQPYCTVCRKATNTEMSVFSKTQVFVRVNHQSNTSRAFQDEQNKENSLLHGVLSKQMCVPITYGMLHWAAAWLCERHDNVWITCKTNCNARYQIMGRTVPQLWHKFMLSYHD